MADTLTIIQRRKKIAEIESDLIKRGIYPSVTKVLEIAVEQGIKTSHTVTYTDMTANNSDNTFLKDFTEHNLSKYLQEMWVALERVLTDATNELNEAQELDEKVKIWNAITRAVLGQNALAEGRMADASWALMRHKKRQLETQVADLQNTIENIQKVPKKK